MNKYKSLRNAPDRKINGQLMITGILLAVLFGFIAHAQSFREMLKPATENSRFRMDKPVMIGEFHFGALDRGLFHAGLVKTADQQERATSYAEYVESALRHRILSVRTVTSIPTRLPQAASTEKTSRSDLPMSATNLSGNHCKDQGGRL